MNVPHWRLDWLGQRLVARGARDRVVSRMTRKELRRLYRAYVCGLFGRRRKLAGLVKKAGEYGQIAATMGQEHRKL